MKISIVIPCKNEAQNLATLLGEVSLAFAGRTHEIIVVDDASTDATPSMLKEEIAKSNGTLRHIRHDRSAGQSAAVRSGVFAASGDIICTMDGDGQNNPVYLPQLVDALIAGGKSCGLAAGQRLKRTDTKLKQFSSKFANNLRQAILQDNTRDSGCGLKAAHANLFRALPYFDGWHRYLPALVNREGFGVVHVDVTDRSRGYGVSNYGILDRGLRGALDLFGVWWLRKRRKTVPVVTEIKP
ncbi:MAG: glycosyltransferase family 2 protein [Notoacmeibacter sp.]